MKPSIEEDANTLQFGPELTDKCQTISISELQLILQSEKDNNSVGSRLGIQTKMLEYIDVVNVQGTKEFINGCKEDLKDFHPFEVAQLLNLKIKRADEAVSLIPSLSRFDDDILATKITQMNFMREMQV